MKTEIAVGMTIKLLLLSGFLGFMIGARGDAVKPGAISA